MYRTPNQDTPQPSQTRKRWWSIRQLLIGLLIASISGLAQGANQYEAVDQIGNWTLYRNNGARIFENYSPPLAIGLESEDGQGAIIIDCRPELDALRPQRYSIRTAQFYLDFVPVMKGLISSPWVTPVAFWTQGSISPRFTTVLPFVSGLMLERLSFHLDSLYDEAKTVVNLSATLVRELNNQLDDGNVVIARFYDYNNRRMELAFDATGFNEAARTLQAGCARINQHAGRFR